MRILNLSYQPVPNLPEHEWLHRSINDLGTTGWTGLIEEVAAFKPDLIIEREWNDSKALYGRIYEAFQNVPKAWWWIDAHVLYEYRKPYARNFDYLFLAVSKFVDQAENEIHRPSRWLPLSCPWEAGGCFPNNERKEIAVSFVARITPTQYFERRIECVKRLQDHFGSLFHFETTPDMVSIVRRSKVSMNCAYNQDLNFRYFEVLGCGTELVTDAVPDLYRVPGLEERVTIYHNFDEMLSLVSEVLHGKIRHNMPEIQQWIRDNHCIEHRYRQIIKELRDAKAVPD
jgi:hypothetical protein